MAETENSPRRFLVHPGEFGKNLRALWSAPTARNAPLNPELAAAYYQHVLCCRVNDELNINYKGNVAAFAKELQIEDSSGLRKKLRGERRAQMEDYLMWAYVLGRKIIPDRYRIYPKRDRSDIYVPTSLRAKPIETVRPQSSSRSAGRNNRATKPIVVA